MEPPAAPQSATPLPNSRPLHRLFPLLRLLFPSFPSKPLLIFLSSAQVCSLPSAPLLGEMGQHLLWVGAILITEWRHPPFPGLGALPGRWRRLISLCSPMPSTYGGLSKHGQRVLTACFSACFPSVCVMQKPVSQTRGAQEGTGARTQAWLRGSLSAQGYQASAARARKEAPG